MEGYCRNSVAFVEEEKMATFKEMSDRQIVFWVVVGMVAVAGVFVVFMAWYGMWDVKEAWRKERVERAFWSEVEKVEGMEVKEFHMWEGDGVARVRVVGKGDVVLWYGEEGLEGIDSLGAYGTSWDCFEVDEEGKKEKYVFSVNLELTEGRFEKWFGMKVKTLEDLVAKYDEIKEGVLALPMKPELVKFGDASGERWVRNEVDEEYVLYPQGEEVGVECDVYVSFGG